MNDIKDVIKEFDIDGKLIDIKCNDEGNINKTYIATYKLSSGDKKSYIIQKINTTVFKEPYKLMRNISNITDWIEKKIRFQDKNIKPYLTVVKTKNLKTLSVLTDENGEKDYYRAYNCIENSVSYNNSKDKDIVYETGKAFGNFQSMLIDYPISKIEETIEGFHDTPLRYENFLKDVELDVCDRVYECSKEIAFVIKNSGCASLITDLINAGKIPIRVTHNDTKVNNVMMDKTTNKFLTVIDLDTVMLGSSLYDYGDGIRSTASSTFEDSSDLDNVYLDDNLFKSYTDGYLSEMAPFLTEAEVCNMAEAIEVITFELGMRFLNDYINGDTYFKTNYDNHNLVRARNQFKLLSDIQKKLPCLREYILDKYKEIIK